MFASSLYPISNRWFNRNLTLGGSYTASANTFAELLANMSTFATSLKIGYVNIVIVHSVPGSYLISDITPGATNLVTSYGIPGYSYMLQRATNLAPAVWVDISTNTAATNGAINGLDTFWDLGGMPPTSAYYRLMWQE